MWHKQPIKGNLGTNFYEKLVQMTSEIGMNPEDLLAVMLTESNIDPASQNPSSNASGLIQFIPSTLKSVGWHGTPEEFRQLSGAEQLDYIQKYIKNVMNFNNGRSFKSAHQYYIGNIWPVGLKLPGVQQNNPSTAILEDHPKTITDPVDNIVWSKKYKDIGINILASTESAAYKANKGLDLSGDGAITVGDLMARMEKNKSQSRYLEVVQNIKNMNNEPTENIDDSFDNIILSSITDEYIKLASSYNKKIYNNTLPRNIITIGISSNNKTNNIEYARILCEALDEELLSKSFVHTDGNNVDVECVIHGPEQSCISAVKAISNAITDSFKIATKKIGGVEINTTIQLHKKSSYPPISLKQAETSYRHFILKFI
jgi:hypothetical protein